VKIGLVCYPTFGGSGVVATELAQALAGQGHEVHLVSYAPPARMDPFVQGLSLHEVQVSSYPLFKYPPYDVALSSRLTEVVEQADLDLIHVHYAIPHAVAALLVKNILAPRPLPVVTTLHGTDITVVAQEPSYTRVTGYAIEQSDVVTAVSGWLARETETVLGTTRPIEVIPNFIDLARFQPEADPNVRACLSEGSRPVLMHVSNFRPVKQSHLVVDAFAHVHATRPSLLVMIGDGPERRRCEERARELGVADHVRFLGSKADVDNLLPAADLFLLPSRFESFGLAALEAMACGVVPVGLAGGGLPEVVEDGVDGLLVAPDADGPAIGARILEALSGEDGLTPLATAARATAETRFARDRIVERYEAAYLTALERTPAT